jgi:hypothetical protein
MRAKQEIIGADLQWAVRTQQYTHPDMLNGWNLQVIDVVGEVYLGETDADNVICISTLTEKDPRHQR